MPITVGRDFMKEDSKSYTVAAISSVEAGRVEARNLVGMIVSLVVAAADFVLMPAGFAADADGWGFALLVTGGLIGWYGVDQLRLPSKTSFPLFLVTAAGETKILASQEELDMLGLQSEIELAVAAQRR